MRAAVAFFALAATWTIPVAPARAQPLVGPGAILARVRDASGRPIAGALVVADGVVSREARTPPTGVVGLFALPLGPYSVRVTGAGFAPYGTVVNVRVASVATGALEVRLTRTSFARASGAAPGVVGDVGANASGARIAALLARDPDANVVPSSGAGGAAVELLGTRPGETRVELDGIPLAGGPGALAALRARSALLLDGIDVAAAPATAALSLRGAAGGIVDYRTPDVDGPSVLGAATGYDSSFGAFSHARVARTFGTLGVLADVVAGGGETRAQTLKVRYAPSAAFGLSYAQYGAQSRFALGDGSVTSSAPAFAAGLHAALGAGTLDARAYGSAAQSTVLGPLPGDAAASLEDARVRGVQAAYAIPLGESSVTFAFDRRAEGDRDASGVLRSERVSTASVRADLRLSHLSRLEIADDYAGGTSLPRRHDPQVALTVSADPRTTLRISAGSAYATAFGDPSVRAATRPETSFALRASLAETLRDGGRAFVAFDRVRIFDRLVPQTLLPAPPTTLAPATFGAASSSVTWRSTGIEAGYARDVAPGHLGGLAFVALRRLPANDDVRSPAAKARAALGYGTPFGDLLVGATLVGANNALAPHALVLGDASLRLTLDRVVDVRVGIANAFGAAVTDPRLAPLYPPREFTLSVGHLPGS